MHIKTGISEPETNGHGVGSTPSTVAAGRPAATGEFQKILADIEDLVSAMTPLSGEDLARAKAKLSERVVAAKESIEEVGGAIADRARRSATVANDYVHQNPWRAVGIGAAVGLLLGLALSRRE